jgi:hypothetical protein
MIPSLSYYKLDQTYHDPVDELDGLQAAVEAKSRADHARSDHRCLPKRKQSQTKAEKVKRKQQTNRTKAENS